MAAPDTVVSSLKLFSQSFPAGPLELGVVDTESEVSNVKELMATEEFEMSMRST